MIIPFAPYRPDAPAAEANSSKLVQNCRPITDDGFGPLMQLAETGSALTARCQGAASFQGDQGTVVTFAGDATKLYLWDGSATWNDVTRTVGGAYATPTDGRWVFVQYRNYVVALNGVDADQVWTIGSSTNFVALSTLGDVPEVARYGAICNDILMLGHVASNVQGVVNSDFFNIGEWTVGTGAADDQAMPNSGRVTGVTGGQYFNIFQQRRITLATPTGTTPAFQFDPVSNDRGTVIPGSIAQSQDMIIFVSNDGFYRLDGGRIMTYIGDKEVDHEFLDNVNKSYLHRVTSVIDPSEQIYIISFPDQNSTDGTPNRTLFFNWSNQSLRWTTCNFGADVLFFMYAQTNLSNLDAWDATYPDLDAVTISLDSELWLGSPIPKLAAFTSAFKLAFFEGATLPITIDTMEAEITPGRLTDLESVRPHIEGTSVQIQVSLGTRNRLNDAVSYGAAIPQNAFGECYFRANARYFRARVTTASGDQWTSARGISFSGADGGDR